MKSQALIIGAVALAIIGVVVFLKTTTGKAVGEQIGGAVSGLVGSLTESAMDTIAGVGNDIAVAANDPGINPLADFGSWLGVTIYDVTH